jgi:hypothetical protein
LRLITLTLTLTLTLLKMRKNFYLCLSKTKAFVKDPVHFVCGETHSDAFPLNAELFFRPYLKVPPPRVHNAFIKLFALVG